MASCSHQVSTSDYDLLELFRNRPTDKALSMGVLDAHSHVG